MKKYLREKRLEHKTFSEVLVKKKAGDFFQFIIYQIFSN